MPVARPGIYRLTNVVTKKSYVGSAVNLKRRKVNHLYDLRQKVHKNKKLQAAFNKYGEDAFEFVVLAFCDKKSLLAREQLWIDTLNSVTGGYNLNPVAGSSLGRKFPFRAMSTEQKLKIGQALLGKKRAPFTKEWCKKLSEVAKRPRPNASASIRASWEGRRAKRVVLRCSCCGSSKVVTEYQASRYATPYRCRKCYLELPRSRRSFPKLLVGEEARV